MYTITSLQGKINYTNLKCNLTKGDIKRIKEISLSYCSVNQYINRNTLQIKHNLQY